MRSLKRLIRVGLAFGFVAAGVVTSQTQRPWERMALFRWRQRLHQVLGARSNQRRQRPESATARHSEPSGAARDKNAAVSR